MKKSEKKDKKVVVETISKEVKKIIRQLKKSEISCFSIPEEYRNDKNIIDIERKLGMRKVGRRGYDVIRNTFFVEEELTNDTIVLHLKSDILYDLEYAVNNPESVLEENVLLIFLNKLIELSQFYILMVREDEKVKEYYKISTKEEISIRLSDSLRWSNPKDVLLFKKRED